MMDDHRILPTPREAPSHAARRAPSRPRQLMAWFIIALTLLLIVTIALSKLAPTHLTGRSQKAVSTSVNVSSSEPFTCDTTFGPGTILKSFPCIPLEISPEEFFENLSQKGGNVGAMFKYAPNSASKWEVYNSSLPNYTTQTLSEFGRFDGVYFVMKGSERLVYLGYMPASINVPMKAGWNLVGYPATQNRQLGIGLSTINTSYTVVKTLEGTAETGTYLVDTPPPGGETLTELELYHGYWINLTSAKEWSVAK